MNSDIKEIIAPLEGAIWKIYMCTTEDQVLEVYREFGLEEQVPSKFNYFLHNDDCIVVAKCGCICKEVFAQVVNMAYTVGFNPSYIYFERLLRQFNS